MADPILFVLEQTGSFPLVTFEWQVEQSRLVLSILVVLVNTCMKQSF